MNSVRLDKFLSDNSPLTRSEIRRAIKRCEVTVNGELCKIFDRRVDPEKDKICLGGETVGYKNNIYLLMYKQSGVLTASTDKNRQTVIDFVPKEYKHYDLFPVGRLDKDTTGLLLITNDGEFAHKVISPKSGIPKSYIATVSGVPSSNATEMFRDGVVLADGTVCKPAKFELLNDGEVRVVLTEGKYHQVKRMLARVGLAVEKLHRESIGKLCLPNSLAEGDFVELSQKELDLIWQ